LRDTHKFSEEEIIRDWSLGQEDLALLSTLNKQYRLWVAVELCSLKLFGQFISNPNELTSEIIAYLCKQISFEITATVAIPRRNNTRTTHKQLIFKHLGFSKFDESRDVFQSWVQEKVGEGIILSDQIFPEAERFLIANKITVPTAYKLTREINSVCHNRQEEIYNSVYAKLPQSVIDGLHETLNFIDEQDFTWFQKFKEYPGSATITLLQDYLGRYQKISEVDLSKIEFDEITSVFAKHLYKMAKYYDARAIKRFRPAKRYTVMLAFFFEARKVLMDYLIEMHDQYISNICRECKNIHETKVKTYKNKNEKAIDRIEPVIDYLLEQEDTIAVKPEYLYQQTTSRKDLKTARDDMRQYKITSKYGYANLLQNRYNSMRRYFADFVQLPFLAEKGNEAIMQAIELIKKVDSGAIKSLPDDAPTEFIDYKIKNALQTQDGTLQRNLWEVGVAMAIKDAFRSGNIFISHSNKHVSFWELVYNKEQWEKEKPDAYQKLNLSQDAKKQVANLVAKFHTTAKKASRNFGLDGFAKIVNGKLKLHKKDKYDPPPEVKRLQTIINSYLPKIKIEQLLIEVDKMTGFTRHLVPIHGQKSRPKNFYKTLIAGILSQATNIGMVTMQDCTTGITIDMLRHVVDACIYEEAIKNSNAEIVNQHSAMALSQAHGDGTFSSSDGQRFAVTASSLLSSYYPRYYGYYEKVINIYTHTSNQFSVYNTNAISCAPRESLYVIDGFLDNNTILAIKEHTTDTEGYTEHIFALCFLLGIAFMPRIKDLKIQQLYKVDKNVSYGEIDALLTKIANLNIVEEQMDEMVRIVASLKNKLAPAHEVLRRLSSGAPSDKISKAFTNLGRIIKTEYILRYITDPELRGRVQRQLNKGEHRHALSRWIFFADQGKFQTGDYEEIMNKASCLSLVSNAVLYWNTIKMSRIVDQLKANGEDISDKTLSHISLLSHRHVVPMGTYFVDGDFEDE